MPLARRRSGEGDERALLGQQLVGVGAASDGDLMPQSGDEQCGSSLDRPRDDHAGTTSHAMRMRVEGGVEHVGRKPLNDRLHDLSDTPTDTAAYGPTRGLTECDGSQEIQRFV